MINDVKDRASGPVQAGSDVCTGACHRGRVLLVEDDTAVREMLAEMLRRAGYGVRTASDGQSAIGQLRHERFDVVLTDVVMPHCDGLELLRWIAERGDGPAVVAMSGNGPDDGRLYTKAASSFGATLCLAKPIRRDALVSALDAVVAPSGPAQEGPHPK
jgi:CheY-like chemotaxis protein